MPYIKSFLGNSLIASIAGDQNNDRFDLFELANSQQLPIRFGSPTRITNRLEHSENLRDERMKEYARTLRAKVRSHFISRCGSNRRLIFSDGCFR